MTDLDRPLHGVATYNPDLLSKDELIASYVARQRLLSRLVAELRREEGEIPQHRMLVGHRGMGKTTALRRLRFAVDDDAQLSAIWLPLVFPEEQYNVASLSDFWLNCVDSLGDALEHRGLHDPLAGLDDQAARVQAIVDEGSRRAEALGLLLALARRIGRRLLLLVDNMDLVLQRLDSKAAWSLREVLSSEPALMMLGAMTAAAMETSFQYDQPFHDFFKVHRLDPLDEDETFAVLRRLSELWSADSVARLIDTDTGRIRALRVLTGGNPRTVVLLFQVLARGPEGGDVRSDLERLLDQCTPLYKARFEALSPQAQRIIDAVAVHWDPVTAARLAELLRLDVNLVSAQVDRLAKQGLIEKSGHYPGKRLAYSLSERFFNIWYLMRASRRVRRKLVWLVEFMRLLYAPADLTRMARAQLVEGSHAERGRQRRGEYALALADAVDEIPLRYALETQGLRCLASDAEIRERLASLLDFDGEDRHLKTRAERVACLEEARESLEAATDATWSGGAGAEFWPLLARSMALSPSLKRDVARVFEKMSRDQRDGLAAALERDWQHRRSRWGLASDAVGRAFAAGYMEELEDIDGARAAAVALGAPEILLVSLYAGGVPPADVSLGEVEAAAAHVDAPGLVVVAAREALRRGAAPANWKHVVSLAETWAAAGALESWEWRVLGDLLCLHLVRYEEAEVAYRRAIELDESYAPAWNNLGSLLRVHLGRFEEAEAAYRKAIELDETSAFFWGNLGALLQDQPGRNEEAGAAYRHAIELDETSAPAWTNLGNLHYHVGRYDEAEAAYRKAIALDETSAPAWNNLGNVLQAHRARFDEAGDAYRKAIALDETFVNPWGGLGNLLNRLGQFEEAEVAYRKAIALDEGSDAAWNGLAWAKFRQRTVDSEALAAARRLLELGEDNPNFLHTAACVLIAAGDWVGGRQVASRLLGVADASFLETTWPDIELLFRQIAMSGHAAEGRDLLDESGLGERWRPVREAMAAVAEGTWRYLLTLAAEVREPTRILLERFEVELADRPPEMD